MHKYSYELSASYRNEAKFPHQYYLPQKIQPTTLNQNSSISRHPPSPSPTFIRSQNTTIAPVLQQPTTLPTFHSSLGSTYSGLKMQEPPRKSSPWHHPKPSHPDNVQDRLKILSHLGQRHEQAIRDIDYSKPDITQSPIRAIYQESALKREFSFNRMPEGATSYQQREETYTQMDSRIRANTLRSKEPALNAGALKIGHTKQKPQLRLNMERAESKGSTWRNQNGYNLRVDKSKGPSQTVAKLSSLQQRIRTTVQPYAKR